MLRALFASRPGLRLVGHVPAEQKRHRLRRPAGAAGRQEKREAVGFLRSPSFELGFCRLALRTGLIRELDPEGTVAVSIGGALSDQPCRKASRRVVLGVSLGTGRNQQ